MKTQTETDAAQHTPTPWKLRVTANESVIRQENDRPDDWHVAQTFGPAEERRTNAAYIVKAVNAHEELVESGKRLIERVKDSCLCSSPELESFRNIVAEASGCGCTKTYMCGRCVKLAKVEKGE